MKFFDEGGLVVLCLVVSSVVVADTKMETGPSVELYEHQYAPDAVMSNGFSGVYGRSGQVLKGVESHYVGGNPVYRAYGSAVDYGRQNMPPYVPQQERVYYPVAPVQQQMMPMPSMAGFGLPPSAAQGFKLPGFMDAWNRELSDAQRDELRQLQKGLRRINHSLSGELMDAVDGIQDVFEETVRDPKRVGQAYQQYFDIQRRWIEAQIAASNRVSQISDAARSVEAAFEVPVPPLNEPVTDGDITVPDSSE